MRKFLITLLLLTSCIANADWRTGMIYDGTNDYADTGLVPNPNEGTIACWFKTSDVTVNSMMFASNDDVAPNGRAFLSIRSSHLSGGIAEKSWDAIYDNAILVNNKLYLATLSWNNGITKLYKNGVIVDTETYSSSLPSVDAFLIARRDISTSFLPFNGYIGAPRVWDRALSDEEIKYLYLQRNEIPDGEKVEPASAFYSGYNSLLIDLDAPEGYTTGEPVAQIHDYSGNGHDGTIHPNLADGPQFQDEGFYRFVDDEAFIDFGSVVPAGDWSIGIWGKLIAETWTTYALFNLSDAGGSEGATLFAGGTHNSYDGYYLDDYVSGSREVLEAFSDYSPYVGEWQFFSVSKSGTVFTIYFNGVNMGSKTMTDMNIDSLILSRRNSDGKFEYNGYMKGLKVYTNVLSDADMMTWYEGNKVPYAPVLDAPLNAENWRMINQGAARGEITIHGNPHIGEAVQVSSKEIVDDRWIFKFHVDTTGSIDPIITAANLTDADVVWQRPDGSVFTGKVPASTEFTTTGDYVLSLPAVGEDMTGMSWYEDEMSSDIGQFRTPENIEMIGFHHTHVYGDASSLYFPDSLRDLYIFDNNITGDVSSWNFGIYSRDIRINQTGLSGDCSKWTLGGNLVIIDMSTTSISGDIGVWTLPSGFMNLNAYNTQVSGDIGGWTLPSGLTDLRLNNTAVNGDIGGWVLPSNLYYFHLAETSVSGDISNWTIPSSIGNFFIHKTSVSGDISQIAGNYVPVYTYFNNTRVTYESTNGLFNSCADTRTIKINDCNLPSNQVDNILVDLDTSGAINGIVDVGGNNAPPTSAGLTAKASLEGKGWTVTVSTLNFEFVVVTTGSIDPVITSSTLGNSDYVWTRPNGTTFTGKSPANSKFSMTGRYILTIPNGGVGTENINFNNDAIDSDLSNWHLPVDLSRLNLYRTDVHGDIGYWNLPSGLKSIRLHRTNVTGDISRWTYPPAMVNLSIRRTGVTYGSTNGLFTAASDNLNVRMDNCNLPQDQIDNILADLNASGATNGTINIAGNNIGPSTAGNVYKVSLEGKGWTVTAN